jgi:hypothetical protein
MGVIVKGFLGRRVVVVGIIVAVFLFSLIHFRNGGALWSFTDNLPSDFGYKTGPLWSGGKTAPSKASTRANEKTLDLIVTMFDEPLEDTKREVDELLALEPFSDLTTRVYIYTKNPDADVEELKDYFKTSYVSRLQNVGREAGTYFHHIVSNWDDLAHHQLFVQAHMHDYEAAKNKIRDYFHAEETGMLSLGLMERCDCVSCKDPWDGSRTYPRLEELYSALNGDFCPRQLSLTYYGQFVVSARRIRSRSKNTYMYLKEILESGEGHWIHADPKQDFFKDEISNPYFGHTLERAWLILWGCDDAALVERCGGNTNLRQRRHHDQPLDHCQCLDPKVPNARTETGDSFRNAMTWIKGFRKIKNAEEKGQGNKYDNVEMEDEVEEAEAKMKTRKLQ